MILQNAGSPLLPAELPVPSIGCREVLVRVHACAVCRTDLHVVDGDLVKPKLPLVIGHEIVGSVIAVGADATLCA